TPAGMLRVQISSRLNTQTLSLDDLVLRSDALPTVLHASGKLALHTPFTFDARGDWQDLAWRGTPVLSEAGQFALRGDTQALDVTLDARAGAQQANLYVTGALNLTQPRFTADLNWRDLTVALASRQYLESAQGRLHVDGTPQAYSAQGDLALRWPGLPDGELTLAAAGDERHVQIEKFSLDWLEGRVQGSGRVAWEPVLAWRADINARYLNPGVLLAAWPGALGGHFALRGETRAKTPDITLQVQALSGSLRGQPVSGSGVVRWQKQTIQADNLRLGWADATLSLDGTRRTLQAVLDIPAVQRLDARGAGMLHAEGEWRGGLNAPQGRLALRAAGLVWETARLETLEVSARVDAAQNISALGSLRDLQYEALALDAATLQLDGTLAAHQLQ